MAILDTPPVKEQVPPATTRPTPPKRRRKGFIAAFVTAAVFAVFAVVWMTVAIPTLVKYPTDLNVTPNYSGTFRVFSDPTSFAPLATPLEAPLSIERHLKADSGASGSSRVVVNETIVQKAGSLLNATQTNTYVMDRRDIVNVADNRATAFTSTNVVDRSGAYRIQLPFDAKATGSYTMYKNETASTYALVGTGETYEREGLTLNRYNLTPTTHALDPVYLSELRKAVPLPETATLDQLKPQLLAAGVDVDALLAALTPVLSADDVQALLAVAAQPIPLEYTLTFSGSVGLDRKTGSEVDIINVHESIGVQPAAAQTQALMTVLQKYSQVPAAASAVQALDKLAGTPIEVANYDYSQTPDSVANIASKVKDMRGQMDLAEKWIPIALVGATVVALVVGVFFVFRSRRPA